MISYTNANEPIASRIRKIVSFEFGKEIEKDVLSSCHEHATKKNSRVPTGNQTLDRGFCALMLCHLATETPW